MGIVVMPVYVLFLNARGVSTGEALTLQSIFALTVLILEIPTGYLCDVIGRKRTIQIGTALNFLGLVVFASAHGFLAYALIQPVLAAGVSLVSGADIALIYDILDEDDADRATRRTAIANYRLAATLGEAGAGLFAGVLATWSLEAVGWATTIEAALSCLVAASLPRVASRGGARLDAVIPAARALFRVRGLPLLLVNSVVWSLSTFTVLWLLPPYWTQQGVDIRWFGLLWAGTLVTTGLSGRASGVAVGRLGKRGALLLLTLAPVVGYALMAWPGGVLGIAAGFLFYVSRGLNGVLLVEEYNHPMPPSLRATFNSLFSGAFRFGFVLLGPVVGGMVDTRGLSDALEILAAGFLLAFLLVAVPMLRNLRTA